MLPMPAVALLTLTAASAALALAPPPCIPPTGIDGGADSSLNSSDLASLPPGTVASNVLSIFPAIGNELFLRYETPIQFHISNALAFVNYNTLAAYEPAALDAFGQREASKLCRPAATEDGEAFRLHRQVSFAYANMFSFRILFGRFPEQLAKLEGVVESWGLDLTKCDGETGCVGGPGTPWAIASAVVEDMKLWLANNGWNSDGGLSRQFNRRPFEDWRNVPYKPSGAAHLCGVGEGGLERWEPVLEDDGFGFSFHQRHVTPHIGETGETMYLKGKEFCARELPDPGYDLEEEVAAALERTAALDETQKVQVEFFDGKIISLLPIQFEYFVRRGISPDSFEFWKWDLALNAAYYDGTLLEWREKVRTDKVRPTTAAEVLGKGKKARAYTGKGEGTKEIPVDQWEPYIRTMPHGSDEFSSLIGGPISIEFAAGSSRIQPGVEPSQNVTLTYNRWSEIAKVCGESRLDGGMHFRAAVPAGVQLCTGIADNAVKAVMGLSEGKIPEYVADIHTPQTKQTRCE